MVFLTALEQDVKENAGALARALGAVGELEETRGALKEVYEK